MPPKAANAIDFLRKYLNRFEVKVYLQEDGSAPKAYHLITLRLQTNPAAEFVSIYGDDLKLLAEKLLGKQEEWQDYYALVDPDSLQIVFAFNSKFAAYDDGKKSIIYKDAQAVLMEALQERDLALNFDPPNFDESKIPKPTPPNHHPWRPRPPRRPDEIVIMYGIFPDRDMIFHYGIVPGD